MRRKSWMRKQKMAGKAGAVLAAAMLCLTSVGCGQTEEASSQGGESSGGNENVTSESGAAGTVDSTAGQESPGSGAGEAKRISEDTITLTVAGMYNQGSGSDWTSTQQFQEYEKRLGLKLEANTYDVETWPSQFSLMLAGDELPDLLGNAGMTVGQVAEYGADGYLLDFSQYLDIMPHLTALMEEYPAYAASIRDQDGHIYAFPALNRVSDFAMAQYNVINTKWLERVGKEIPETLDELYDVLTAFKEQDANGNGDPDDEIPFGLATAGGTGYFRNEMYVLYAHGIYSQLYVFHVMDDGNGKVVLGDTTENYKAFLKYMNKLYKEGLINKDAFVLTAAELKTLVTDDKVGISAVSADCYGEDPISQYRCINGYRSDYSPNPTAALSSRVAGTYKLAANADTKYPEEIAKFVDYLFTEEGALSCANGYEGVTFDYRDVKGTGVVDHTNFADGYDSPEQYRQEKAVAIEAFSILSVKAGTIYEMFDKASDQDLEAGPVYEMSPFNSLRAMAMREEGLELYDPFPGLKYTEEELTERTSLYTDISNYLKAAKADFIIGERDIDSEWEAHIATLNQMGLERFLEIEQAAYDRYLESIK